MDTFDVVAMVRRYHTYKDVWEASVGESLRCKWEAGNSHDPYAVSVLKGETIVPRFTSSICCMFLHRGDAISCVGTGSRRLILLNLMKNIFVSDF